MTEEIKNSLNVLTPIKIDFSDITDKGIVMNLSSSEDLIIPAVCKSCKTSEVLLKGDPGYVIVKADVTIHGYGVVEAFLKVKRSDVEFLEKENGLTPFPVDVAFKENKIVLAEEIASSY